MKYLLLLAMGLGLFFLIFGPQDTVYSQSNDPYTPLRKILNTLPPDSGVYIEVEGDPGYKYVQNQTKQFPGYFKNSDLSSPQSAVNFVKDLVNSGGGISESDPDPFRPSSVLPAQSEFIGKSGILGEGRNDLGAFLDSEGNRVYFAIFLPSGGTSSETLISSMERLMYAPTVPLADTTGSSQTYPITQPAGITKGSRLCVKVGEPSDLMPEICNTPTFGDSSAGGSHPKAPAPQGDLQIEIQRQFGISMTGFDQQHLKWAWEKFWEVSSTNFNSLIQGAVIEKTDISSTRQVGCPPSLSVLVGQFPEESAFKHILTHELGHVIRNCPGRQAAQETAFLNAFSKEGGVSYYAQNANSCTGSDDRSEDYAEMIAFYLNPGTPVASYLKCYLQPQNRFSPEQFPLHYQVARDVLGEF